MIDQTAHLSKRQLVALRKQGEIVFGGHRKHKIYGTLICKGAKRWIAKGHYVKQRVFFNSEKEALEYGYRPCAQCMPKEYITWKASRFCTNSRSHKSGD